MSGDDLLRTVQALEGLVDGGRARDAALLVAGRLSVAELLRAAGGVQQFAQALDAIRRDAEEGPRPASGYDPHDVRSLYT